EVLLQAAVVGPQELPDGEGGHELVLGVGPLRELRGVRRQGRPGGVECLPGDRQRGLGHRSGGSHASLEGSDRPEDFDRASRAHFFGNSSVSLFSFASIVTCCGNTTGSISAVVWSATISVYVTTYLPAGAPDL